jgi:ribA/ribD-fused uncharacterized protein
MPIARFVGKYRFLSNFYPVELEYEGAMYRSLEHAYQAAKTMDFEQRAVIRAQPTPGRAKSAGRKVALRNGWELMKVDVMHGLLRQKFRDPELRRKLAATGEVELVEGNTWGDRFWGVDGTGKNWLGKLLMEVRKEITCQ